MKLSPKQLCSYAGLYPDGVILLYGSVLSNDCQPL